jgi:elastase-2
MYISAIALLAVLGSIADARPKLFRAFDIGAAPSFSFEPFVVGGEDATPGEFPWQLSQQRLGTSWSHSCGASLLSSRYALSAAHCVDGANPSVLRVVAGQHSRSDYTGTQTSTVTYKMHERYNADPGTFSNDIAILTLDSPVTIGGNVQVATLPQDNSYLFDGDTCVISGWGRTSAAPCCPDILQKGSIEILSNAECQTFMNPVSGALINSGHICIFDRATNTGACNGDSGGPLNCNLNSQRVVAGVTSWVVQGLGTCLQSYPSVYTRTGYFIDWIRTNTP